MAKKKTHGGFRIYRTHRFTGQEPAVKELMRFINDEGSAADKAEVSHTTLRNWRTAKTRRPQFSTMQAVAVAVGKRFRLEDDK